MSLFFQLRIKGISIACESWLVSYADCQFGMYGELCSHFVFLQEINLSQKQDDTKAAFVLAIQRECGTNCTISDLDIVSFFYTCSATNTAVAIFHARVTLSLPILESAGTVIAIKSAVQEWSSASPELRIGGQLLVVDGSCPPVVSSFLDPECGMTETSASPSPTTSLDLLDDLTAVIVMGVLGAILLVLVAVIIVMCCTCGFCCANSKKGSKQ